jgi:hypothetical protein
MSIFSHIKGAVQGFARGGIAGGAAGLVAGQNNGRKVRMKPGVVVKTPTTVNVPTANSFSAAPLVRFASDTALVPLPQGNALQPLTDYGQVDQQYFRGYLPGGASPPGMGTNAATPMWAYRRLYTKRGTPRRTRRDGMPYAVPRMNPMNVRAARRAITRIRGARKLLQRIERSLPKQTVRRRRAA